MDDTELGYFSGATTHGSEVALTSNLRRATSWYIELEDLTKKKVDEPTVRKVVTIRKRMDDESTVRLLLGREWMSLRY